VWGDSELIAGLGVGAPVGVDLDRPAARELEPGRVLEQRDLDGRSAKGRRCISAPTRPDIAPNIGLPHLSAVGDDGRLGAQAEASCRAVGRAEIDGLKAVKVVDQPDMLPEDLPLWLQDEARPEPQRYRIARLQRGNETGPVSSYAT